MPHLNRRERWNMKKYKFTLSDLLTGAFLIGICILVLLPFVWMVSTSLKEATDVYRVPIQWIPDDFQWQNYPQGWARRDFTTYFINSSIVAISVTASTLILSSLAGFG